MQLYIIAPLILIPLYKMPKLGWTILLSFLAGSMMITGYITFVNHFPAVPYMNGLM